MVSPFWYKSPNGAYPAAGLDVGKIAQALLENNWFTVQSQHLFITPALDNKGHVVGIVIRDVKVDTFVKTDGKTMTLQILK